MTDVERQLVALTTMTSPQLKDEWRRLPVSDFAQLFAAGASISDKVRQRDPVAIRRLIAQVKILSGSLELVLTTSAIAEVFARTAPRETEITLPIPIRITRTGHSMRLIQNDGRLAVTPPPNATLIKLLVKARRWWGKLCEGQLDVTTLARQEGVARS